jgi:hypothetical protein
MYDALQAYFWNAYCVASSSTAAREAAPRSSAARTITTNATKDSSCLVS